MKVATFNVNLMTARFPVLSEWLKKAAPDGYALHAGDIDPV